MVFAVIMLAILFGVSVIHIFRLKKDIGSLGEGLDTMKNFDTNLRLTTITDDKDIRKLALLLNEVLDDCQKLVIQSERNSRELKQGITNISHDLRTPLTSAMGYTQLLKSGKVSEEKRLAYLDIIENRLKTLTVLMKELFDYTQIIEGKMQPRLEKVNVSHILGDKLSTFYEDFQKGGFEVEVNFLDVSVFAICDVQFMERVFENLIQNVLLHGQSFFQLTVWEQERRIIFSNKVANSEKVIADRLFERFYTADSSRSSKRTGLGLAITKELLQSMGGDIRVDLVGDLLSFSVQLPK